MSPRYNLDLPLFLLMPLPSNLRTEDQNCLPFFDTSAAALSFAEQLPGARVERLAAPQTAASTLRRLPKQYVFAQFENGEIFKMRELAELLEGKRQTIAAYTIAAAPCGKKSRCRKQHP